MELDTPSAQFRRSELKGCQSQGASIEDVLANIREAIETVSGNLPDDERDARLSREITTSIEVHA